MTHDHDSHDEHDHDHDGGPHRDEPEPVPVPAALADPARELPLPWELPFTWDDFVATYFAAIDAVDVPLVLRFSRLDLVSERVGISRNEWSRDGFVATYLAPLWRDFPGGIRHDVRLVVVPADAALDVVAGAGADISAHASEIVVEWRRHGVRADGSVDVVDGITFLRVDRASNQAAQFRSFERPAAADDPDPVTAVTGEA